ncbi:NAD(P)/FAD-dependent oxidoreductase [Microbacterium sp. KSW4-16]|uniref:phytoene desaturase family protein n=1 Tax=Microbacterium aurugineum TaxID=2851642 RepID=UPI0020BE7229|nr:NAD(P)/FAD-dependent oxidoreductase [Microbacterium aurugineum]MCK8469049.1 NAD(P)/FAD-dependent oxidoreductase [Microbacterium aurugineum]
MIRGNAVDAIVVGAGPNGLAAALTLARAGLEVHVFEQSTVIGGGCRTEKWGDGYSADWGAAVHPMALASPFFQELGLAEKLEFRTPEISFAHPLEGGAAVAWRSLDRTEEDLASDGPGWRRLVEPMTRQILTTAAAALGPPRALTTRPRQALLLGGATLRGYCRAQLRTREGRSLLAGVIGHSVSPQPRLGASAAGVVLAALAHSVGWPIPIGGSSAISGFLANELLERGGKIHTDTRVSDIRQLPHARAYFFDTSATDMISIATDRIDPRYSRALGRMRYGNAVSKVDLILSGPIPWADARLAQAGTIHMGGDDRDIRRAEAEVAQGRHAENPMIVLSQPSTFDATRVPPGLHAIWSYAHVPAGSDLSQQDAVLRSLERVAPGVRDLVVSARSTSAREIGIANPAMPGGDFASGAITTRQILARPSFVRSPWSAGNGIYLCSGASAPGPGVHGMGGYSAAQAALREEFM